MTMSKKSSRNVASIAASVAAFAGAGGEAAQVLHSKSSQMFETGRPCGAPADDPSCCDFGGQLQVYGSNALSPDAAYYQPSQDMDAGVQLAIDEINDKCGVVVNDIHYSLSYTRVGDGSNADTARGVAATLLGVALGPDGEILAGSPINYQDSIAFYVAPYSSSLCKEVNPVTSISGKATIAPGCSAQSVYDGNKNVFGVRVPAEELMTPPMTALALAGASNVVSVVEGDAATTPFTHSVCSKVETVAKSLSQTFLSSTELKTNDKATDKEIDDMVKQWKAQDAKTVVGCTYEDMCHRIIESMIRNDFDPEAMVMSECVGTESLGKKLQGVVGSSPFPHLATASKDYKNDGGITDHEGFAAAYKKHTGKSEVSIQAAASYAGVKLMADALQSVQSTNGTLIAKHLHSQTLPTAFGDFQWDNSGQPLNKAVVMQYDANMKLQVVYPADKKSSGAALVFPKPKWATLIDDDSGAGAGDGGAGGAAGGDGDAAAGGQGSADGNGAAAHGANEPSKVAAHGPDYTNAIVGSVVGGLFMLGAMLIIALAVYAYLIKIRRQA